MDVQMPTMCGLECSRKIRASGKPYAGIPIIALSANAMEAEVGQCLAAGMNSHIPKPINRAMMLMTLKTCAGHPSRADWSDDAIETPVIAMKAVGLSTTTGNAFVQKDLNAIEIKDGSKTVSFDVFYSKPEGEVAPIIEKIVDQARAVKVPG